MSKKTEEFIDKYYKNEYTEKIIDSIKKQIKSNLEEVCVKAEDFFNLNNKIRSDLPLLDESEKIKLSMCMFHSGPSFSRLVEEMTEGRYSSEGMQRGYMELKWKKVK